MAPARSSHAAAAALPSPSVAGTASPRLRRAARPAPRRANEDPPWVRYALTGLALLFLGLFVGLPVALVLVEALGRGAAAWWGALSTPDARAAIRLTVVAAAIAVPLNAVFGVAAAWSLTRFRYGGKSVLVSLIDVPFGVSPVISGMTVVLLFGAQGYLGPWLVAHGLQVVFALPGIVVATVFVTFPFVARELIPFMEAQGTEEEEAALVMGASGWQILTKVTLPNVKWSLFYGIVLCNARAMGEFGAVSVVSGHIRGETNTIPLHVEILYNEYTYQAAFAVASFLFLLALVTLVAKGLLEWKTAQARRAAGAPGEPA